MSTIIGIDLGTTFSLAAGYDETGRPFIIPNRDNQSLTPSCVVIKPSGNLEVGEYARRQWATSPRSAAARFKRQMGTTANISLGGKNFTPTDLSTFVLKKVVQDTIERVGAISEAVVTIPANFAHEAREATMAAAKAAGLNVKYIINEPTAAAFYYAHKYGDRFSGTFAVYDLGGGTFDISIIRVTGQDVDVVATNGIPQLGGHDFDEALQRLVANKYERQTGKQFDPQVYTRNDAERSKIELSDQYKINIDVRREYLEINQLEFEEAISSLLAQTELLCEATLEDASLQPENINGIILVGGSTRIPAVQESVRKIFQKEPISVENVDEVVALGAALYAAYKSDRSKLLPAQRKSISQLKLNETTSKCFGTISVGYNQNRNQQIELNNILIAKGSKIPCSITESFYTLHNDQRAVNCTVTESVSPETDPRFVKIIWTGELALPSGRPAGQEIKVNFSYDENQIMKCSFLDVATGKQTEKNLSMADSAARVSSEIDRFLVE